MNISIFRRFIPAGICLFAIVVSPGRVGAADIHPLISGSYRAIVIEGAIRPGDFATFIRIVRENQSHISTVYIFSPGGDFYEAMKIGRAMRALDLASQVPMRSSSGHPICEEFEGVQPKPSDPNNCVAASAAFFIHIGGTHRGGTYLAVHRPSFEKGNFGNLSEADARKVFDALQVQAREYMEEMGVPKHIQEEVLGTPSDRVSILDEKTVKTYFWKDLPYLDEWIRNRCSRMSDGEKLRMETYVRRAEISKPEQEDRLLLSSKQREELDCAVNIWRQLRAQAYEKYFGEKPNDFANHNFGKWSEAPKYLGKRFYELQGEERFQLEDDVLKISSLTRSATANSPYISLMDSPAKPKVVGRINLVSAPNPSPEFTRRLVDTLEDAWGKPSGGNSTTEWLWDKEEFTAILGYEPVSADGPFLNLVIDAPLHN